MEERYDIVVIGGGVIGCSIARELSKYQVKILLLEKESDVTLGTSGKNSGVVHSGLYPKPGSLKARLNVEGNRLFPKFCEELDVPFRKIGTLVVAKNKDEVKELKRLKKIGDTNGVPGIEIISQHELKKMEPNIKGVASLYSPTGGITSPYTLTIALAENALLNGVKISLNNEVKGIRRENGRLLVKTEKGEFKTGWVINSAGLFADRIAQMVGISDYRIYPCRGEYHILDKRTMGLINRMVYPVPPKEGGGKGIHLTPTISGNILIGPSAAYIRDREDTKTTKRIMKRLFQEAKEFLPKLTENDFIHNYSGNRAKLIGPKVSGFSDFVIEESPKIPYFINLIGIESPGLTCAPAIAKMVVNIIKEKEGLRRNRDFNPKRHGIKRFSDLSLDEKERLIKENPNFGEIICRCEEVTRQEIISAIKNPLGVVTLSGIKYRTRAGMGRCQGGYCLPKIVGILEEFGISEREITLKGKGSSLFYGRMRE
ncbi:MAG: NAD(P)/FAD-dependent oxidoreductase [bacterium]|nr:NAD(P)/FAD-dependent oxidoreductase [bacterium]